MLVSRYKTVFNQALNPIAAVITRSGVSPTVLTLAAPLLGLLVCLWFTVTRAVLPFCLVMVLVGLLDALDGAVARIGGRVTQFGGYLDAVCDRYVDSIVAITIGVVTGYWVLCMRALVGALLVSYTKARAAMEVSISNQEWPDLMERAERTFLFMGGLAASALIPWRPLGHDLFWWTLICLVPLIHLTVLQRILRARRFIRQRAPVPTRNRRTG